jgi:tellurite resistance protein
MATKADFTPEEWTGLHLGDEIEPYRRLVLGIARTVAEAKGGLQPIESSMIETIEKALGVG